MDLTIDVNATQRLRVLIVGRQPLARAGLRGLVGELSDMVVAGVTTSVDDAALAAKDQPPDVVLAASDAADSAALAAMVATLAAEGIPTIVLGQAPAPEELALALRAGLRGYVLSDASADEVGAALRAAARGLLVLAPVLGRALPVLSPTLRTDFAAGDAGEQPLTDREREVLQLLSQGMPNKTIARKLGVSEHTVKFHVGSILAKLDASSRTEAVTSAARRGLLVL
jgi:DNA-binding NarL/FixJ family response regulator